MRWGLWRDYTLLNLMKAWIARSAEDRKYLMLNITDLSIKQRSLSNNIPRFLATDWTFIYRLLSRAGWYGKKYYQHGNFFHIDQYRYLSQYMWDIYIPYISHIMLCFSICPQLWRITWVDFHHHFCAPHFHSFFSSFPEVIHFHIHFSPVAQTMLCGRKRACTLTCKPKTEDWLAVVVFISAVWQAVRFIHIE